MSTLEQVLEGVSWAETKSGEEGIICAVVEQNRTMQLYLRQEVLSGTPKGSG
jgi:hypothetical protein